jgi:hypothetical protein
MKTFDRHGEIEDRRTPPATSPENLIGGAAGA